MKKLLPILIGLSLTGFSAMSQAENLLQVYQQARLSNLTCAAPLLTATPHSKKLTKPAVLYFRSSAWVQITPITAVFAITTA